MHLACVLQHGTSAENAPTEATARSLATAAHDWRALRERSGVGAMSINRHMRRHGPLAWKSSKDGFHRLLPGQAENQPQWASSKSLPSSKSRHPFSRRRLLSIFSEHLAHTTAVPLLETRNGPTKISSQHQSSRGHGPGTAYHCTGSLTNSRLSVGTRAPRS